MKNRMIFIVMMGFINLQGYAQLSIAPSESFAVCPDEWITYVVSNTDPFGCSYDWSVTNGEIDGNPNSDTANIKWSNSTDNGSVTISSINCNTSVGEGTITRTIHILSINGVTPSSITGSLSVAANITTNKVYEVAQINFPNVGSGDVSPYEVSDYEWQLPTGWTIVSGGTTKSITVKPDNFSEGAIRVRGKNTNCQNGPFFSNWSLTLPVSRTVATPSAITGNNGNDFVICGDTSPITFQVPTVTGATGYTWTKPSGWGGSSSTNSITLTPNGSNTGTITVKANSGPYTSAASSKTLSIEATDLNNPPTIAGSTTVCTTGSVFIIYNVPSQQTVTWAVSPSNLVSTASGTGTAANISAASWFSKGAATITFTVTGCTKTNIYSKPIWVGKPSTFSTNPSGVPAVQASLGSWVVIRVNSSTPGALTSSLNWWTNNFNALDLNVGSANCSVECQQTGYNSVYVTSSNACGTSPFQQIPINVTSGGGGGGQMFSVMPNPSSSYIDIELPFKVEQGKGEKVDVSIFNDKSNPVYNKTYAQSSFKINTQSLPEGLYYLQVVYKEKLYSQQILIKR